MIGFVWRSLIFGWVAAGIICTILPDLSEREQTLLFFTLPMLIYLFLEVSSDIIAYHIYKKQKEQETEVFEEFSDTEE